MRINKIAVILILVVLINLIYFGITRAPTGKSNPVPADSQQIQDVIHHSYTVFRGALRNGGDVSGFDEVFINTDDYHYENKEVQEFVELVYGPEIANQGGYLTTLKAKYTAYGCAVRKYKDFERTAKKEDRRVSSDEFRIIRENCYGMLPPSLNEGPPPKLDFEKIEIDGDRAIVRYDDGAALLEATLVRVGGRWLIAKIEPLDVHF